MSATEAIVIHVDKDLEDLIPEFLANRQDDVAAIRGAVDAGDYETIRVLGHGMKGSGGGFGFDDISSMGAAIEQAAKRQDGAVITAELARLADYLARVEVIYEEL